MIWYYTPQVEFGPLFVIWVFGHIRFRHTDTINGKMQSASYYFFFHFMEGNRLALSALYLKWLFYHFEFIQLIQFLCILLFNPIYSTLIYSVVLKGVDFYLNEIILNFEMLTLINVTLNYFVKWWFI